MRFIDHTAIIRLAWSRFSASKRISSIIDISAKVSTNHVFKVEFESGNFVIAKLSYFGSFEHFKEDHTIINALANNLLFPYEYVVARSLVKNNEVYTYRYDRDGIDVWVVFYNPIRTLNKLPKKLEDFHIERLGDQIARFHHACHDVIDVLPESSKTIESDLKDLLEFVDSEDGQFEHRMFTEEIKKQCDLFFENAEKIQYKKFDRLPVFVDWNIGNFSVTDQVELYSRWDYDWFRVGSRVLDFYFFSRVVREDGDQTMFSYTVDPLMEDRFILFLQHYHKAYPLTREEVLFIPEAYRFFLLNYVVKFGRYFFLDRFALKLKQEAFSIYFPELDKKFNADKILKALNL